MKSTTLKRALLKLGQTSLTFKISSAKCEVIVSKHHSRWVKFFFFPIRVKMLHILYFLVLFGWAFAFHPVTVPSHMLVGNIYRSIQDSEWLSCIQACHDDPKCISYNFRRSTDGFGVCEMIDCGLEDLCNKGNHLMFSSGAMFQQLASPRVR